MQHENLKQLSIVQRYQMVVSVENLKVVHKKRGRG